MISRNQTPRKNKHFDNYKVVRHTWGQNIAKSTFVVWSGQTEEEANAAMLRDQIRMMDIGWNFTGTEGVRNIHGLKDYCMYSIVG